ncbi:site-specific integrase [Candidatus Woesebacteria bacterium]|nr:site-specific integrase [Candidatus Woesebacteria bacterium]
MAYFKKKDNLFNGFIHHLKSLGVSVSTLKNYKSDISFFSNWVSLRLKQSGIVTETFSETIPFLSPKIAQEFRASQSSQIHAKKTVNRRLSSLRALSRFLVETQVLEADFMNEVANLGTTENSLGNHPLLTHFKKHLEEQNVSKNTVKNYLSDIKHFLSWLELKHKDASQLH